MRAILFEFGPIQIYWYSFILMIGVLVGGLIAINEAKKWEIPEDFMINLFFFLIPISLLGARLYFVAFNWSYYSNNLIEILKVWEGGMGIHGGIIFGLLWVIIYSKKYKVNTLRLLDILAVGFIIAQAIGRWGNFFNQEAYGAATTLTNLQKLRIPDFIIDKMLINGTYYHPTFLYESVLCLIGFIVLLIVRRLKYIKIGQIISLYFIWYGTIRFFIEGLRLDSLMLKNFKMAQIVSIVMIVTGIIMFIICGRGSKLDRRYNDKENVDNVMF